MMISRRSQSSELAGMVASSVQKLQVLDESIKSERWDQDPEYLQSSVEEIIGALKELEAERLRLYELLETETIKASVLRYKLQYMPGDIKSELQDAVTSARQSNEAEIKGLRLQLNTINKNTALLKKRQQDLDTENARLLPVRDDMHSGHDDIIALLNQRMADKASKQITLNETRDRLREAYKRIIDLEDSIVQLKDDLGHERDDAGQEKVNLRQSVADTQQKAEEQRMTNATIRKEIDKLQEELVDSDSALDSLRKIIRQLETSRSKLEAQEGQLNKQLQKEIRGNSQLTQEGMMIVKEHVELSEHLNKQKDYIANELEQYLKKLKILQFQEENLNAEKEELVNELAREVKERERESEEVRDSERKLVRAKENLAQQNAECARMKRENYEIEVEVEQMKESHQATVEGYNKQIEESRKALNAERKDRQILQSNRDEVTKESNEFKSDYGKYMASMSKKVTEGKAEHARLTNYGTQLQKDLKQDEVNIIKKQKQLKKGKQDYTSLQKNLKTDLNTIQESLARLEKEKNRKKEIIEDKTPVYKDLEAQFKDISEEYEKTKRTIVDLKNKRAGLETSVNRAEKDVEKMVEPQIHLREQLRQCRVKTLEQLKSHSKDVQGIEKDIFTEGQKFGAVLKENHRLKEAIRRLESELHYIDWNVDANKASKQTLEEKLVDYRALLHEGWSEDLKLDEVFAKRDTKMLDDIQSLQKETRTREESVDDIHSQLEEQLVVLSHFMDGIANLRPKDTAQSEKKASRARGKDKPSPDRREPSMTPRHQQEANTQDPETDTSR